MWHEQVHMGMAWHFEEYQRYGASASLAGIGVDKAASILASTQFATGPQALQSLADLEQGPHRLA